MKFFQLVLAGLLSIAMLHTNTVHAADDTKASNTTKFEQIEKQTQGMREMHSKWLASKTPKERQALSAQQVQLMQESMTLMDQMEMPCGGKTHHSMHRSRKDDTAQCQPHKMMHAMIQLVIDHLATEQTK